MIKEVVGLLTLITQIIAIIAYYPQIRQLLREKNAAGMSVSAWSIWVVSNAIAAAYAVFVGDVVLILRLSLSALANIFVLILIVRYRSRQYKVNSELTNSQTRS